ncbi:hypothetical protein ACJIZ3_019664 [Penstemon smallii]|uniref:Ubiquitin-like domain-containing protein n=1 Tax=Penstemon smallii TaxID=265156 RepID=A0ABD3T1Y6_9LAMI
MNLISIVFLFNGLRLQGKQNLDELIMEDGNEIDALLHQIGGQMLNKQRHITGRIVGCHSTTPKNNFSVCVYIYMRGCRFNSVIIDV